MQKSLGEIAELVKGVVEGDETTVITGVSGIKEAKAGDITFLANPKYLPLLATTSASAVIVGHDAPVCKKNLIRTEHPYLAFTQVLKLFAVQLPPPEGIHSSAIRGRDVSLAENVCLHAGVILEDGCKVSARSVLYPGVCVGRRAEIGTDCMIYPRVVIGQNARIGNSVIIHMGAIIGGRPIEALLADTNEDASNRSVVVEDDVEIGANVAIDGPLTERPTIIGGGTKIDNLVHIGAGAVIGSNCIIVSHSSIGSGCRVGNGVIIAGQASILDGITVGDGTVIAARSGVSEDIGANQVVSGFPASNHEKWLRVYASMKRLPDMVRDIRYLEKRLQELEKTRNAKTDHD